MPGIISHQHAKAALVIGIIEVVLGVGLVAICIALNTIAKSSTNDIPASPFMNVGALIGFGMTGITVGIRKNKCLMTCFMVENIILTVVQGASAVFLMLVVVVLKVFVGHIGDYCSTVNGSCVCSYTGTTHTIKDLDDCEQLGSITTLLTVMLGITVSSVILGFTASIFGCVSVCCTRNVVMDPVIVETHQMQAVPTYREIKH